MTEIPTIPLFDLNFGDEETEAVLRVLQSKWLTMGAETDEFEREFASYIGIKHAIATTNCTTALHLANIAIGLGRGDEVICPSLTFVATLNSILYTGATPVFADISSINDWTLSPEDITKHITSRTKAIMVMHYGGFSCDMDSIRKIAESHNLKIIEDAAHAPGSSYRDKQLGSIGDVSCFSFFSNKNISTGEGGMLCTNDDAYAREARFMRSHGMTTGTVNRYRGHAFTYDVVRHGYNYRMDEIHAAIGRVQLRKLDIGNELRRCSAQYYRLRLSGLAPNITIPFQGYEFKPNYHIFPILLKEGIDRYSLMKYLFERGIQTSIHYPPVHLFSYYHHKYGTQQLPLTEEIARREVTLPMYPSISKSNIDRVVEHMEAFLADM